MEERPSGVLLRVCPVMAHPRSGARFATCLRLGCSVGGAHHLAPVANRVLLIRRTATAGEPRSTPRHRSLAGRLRFHDAPTCAPLPTSWRTLVGPPAAPASLTPIPRVGLHTHHGRVGEKQTVCRASGHGYGDRLRRASEGDRAKPRSQGGVSVSAFPRPDGAQTSGLRIPTPEWGANTPLRGGLSDAKARKDYRDW